MITELFVEIGGFVIKIELHRGKENERFNDNYYQRRKFIRQLKGYLRYFIIDALLKKSDFTIIIKETYPIFIDSSQTGTISIPIFKKISETKIKTYYYLNIYQFQMILRDIVFKLITKTNGGVFHASAVVLHNKGYLFLGKANAGKSTIMRLLENISLPLADDTVIIRKENKKYFLYQTPFVERQRWIKKRNKKYELSCIFFIHKSMRSYIEKVDISIKVLDRLLDQILIAKENKEKIVKWSASLMKNGVQFYELYFRKNKKDVEEIWSDL